MGSGAAVEAGAYHQRASVGQSAANPAAVATAIRSEAASAIRLSTGSTGSLIGCPLMRSGTLFSSPSPAGLSARNEPYNAANVASANSDNTSPWRLRVFQNTPPYPSESNQRAST